MSNVALLSCGPSRGLFLVPALFSFQRHPLGHIIHHFVSCQYSYIKVIETFIFKICPFIEMTMPRYYRLSCSYITIKLLNCLIFALNQIMDVYFFPTKPAAKCFNNDWLQWRHWADETIKLNVFHSRKKPRDIQPQDHSWTAGRFSGLNHPTNGRCSRC